MRDATIVMEKKSKIDAENRLQKRIEGDGEREQSVRKRILGELDIINLVT